MKVNIYDRYLSFVDRNYKKILGFSIALFFIAVSYLIYRALFLGNIVNLGIEITGGYLIILPEKINIKEIETFLLSSNLREYNIYSSGGNIYVELPTINIDFLLNKLKEYGYLEEEITIQEFSNYIGSIVLNQLVLLIIISSILVSIFIALRFRKKQPLFGILSVIIWDFILVITLINIFNIRLGFIGLVTLLGILGFAIDNNVVLTSNVFQEKELPFNERIKMSLKVGLLMELFILLVIIPLLLMVKLPVVSEFSIIWLFIVLSDTYAYLFLNIPLYYYFEKIIRQQ